MNVYASETAIGRPSSLELTIDEAVELCTAWLQRLADNQNIRLIVLKGDALARQGLRPEQPSSDVDVLVEPGKFEEFLALVARAGWSEFEVSFAAERFATHSRTLHRVGWPNSVDIHAFWPGFLAPREDSFEAIWARCVTLCFARQRCFVPDRVTHALMLALHSLRSGPWQSRHKSELEGVLQLQLSDAERISAGELLQATGSASPLQEVARRLDIEIDVSHEERHSPKLREWRRTVEETEGRAAFWLAGLLQASWREKPRMLRHALWPTDRDILLERPGLRDTHWQKNLAKVVRLGRGICQLPRVIRRRALLRDI